MDITQATPKQKKALIGLVLVLLIIIAFFIALPNINLLMLSSNYHKHTTHLILDLKADYEKPVKLETTSALFDSDKAKTTSFAYCKDSKQLLFGMTGKTKNIEKKPFIFKIRDEAGNYLDFSVLASNIEKYWGSRLLPFYIQPVSLEFDKNYVLEIYVDTLKTGEVAFNLPSK